MLQLCQRERRARPGQIHVVQPLSPRPRPALCHMHACSMPNRDRYRAGCQPAHALTLPGSQACAKQARPECVLQAQAGAARCGVARRQRVARGAPPPAHPRVSRIVPDEPPSSANSLRRSTDIWQPPEAGPTGKVSQKVCLRVPGDIALHTARVGARRPSALGTCRSRHRST